MSQINNALLTGLGLLSGDIYVAQSVASMADCALPNLAMSKSGPSTATVGTPFDYVLSLANIGGLATSGTITVTDTIPATLAINSVVAGANFNCGVASQTVTCTTSAPIGAGASNVTVATITVTPTQVGQVSNTAVVSGGGDDTPGNNTSPPVGTTGEPSAGAGPRDKQERSQLGDDRTGVRLRHHAGQRRNRTHDGPDHRH